MKYGVSHGRDVVPCFESFLHNLIEVIVVYYVESVDILDDCVYVGDTSNWDTTKFQREYLTQLIESCNLRVVGASIRKDRGVVFNRSSRSIAILEGCVREGDVVQIWSRHGYEEASYCGYDPSRRSYIFRREDGASFRVTKVALRNYVKAVKIPISL